MPKKKQLIPKVSLKKEIPCPNTHELNCFKKNEIEDSTKKIKRLQEELDNSFDQLCKLRTSMQDIFNQLMVHGTTNSLINSKLDQVIVSNKTEESSTSVTSETNKFLNYLNKAKTYLTISACIGVGTGVFFYIITNFDKFAIILKGFFK